MVTINLALTVPLNPPGYKPLITKAQAWSALVRKARRPQDFVPVVSSCTVIFETPTEISAEVHFYPGTVSHAAVIKEVCTLHPPCRLDYEMEGGSTAVNIVSEGPGGELMLTFSFGWVHADVVEGSVEAREIRENHGKVRALVITTRDVEGTDTELGCSKSDG